MKMFSAAARLSAVVRRIVSAEFHASLVVSTLSPFPWGLVLSFSLGFSGRFFLQVVFHLGFQRQETLNQQQQQHRLQHRQQRENALKNAPTLALGGFDTAENEPPKV